jgi:predicted Zn-dependent peptidase
MRGFRPQVLFWSNYTYSTSLFDNMIRYKQFTLDNGLRVFVHEDFSTPMAAVNILYNVGSRDEDEERTGFAHLFEHLMFGGSKNIPSYDIPVQNVGRRKQCIHFSGYYQLLHHITCR